MLVALDKRIYIIKAGSELSNIELKALANELHSMIPKTAKGRKELSVSGEAN